MQIKPLFRLLLAVLPLSAVAQSSYIRTGSQEYRLLNRLEIKTRSPLLTQSFVKPYSRKNVFIAIDSILKDSSKASLTSIDKYRIRKLLSDPEWNNDAKTIYHQFDQSGLRSKGNNGFLYLAPVLRAELSKETNNDKLPLLATAGLDFRGAYKKIGFSFYATKNKERLPEYLDSWISRYHAVPGAGNFKNATNGKVSYWDVRGSIHTSVTKYIDLQLGYDKFFLGDGYRSLFLSDFSNSAAFFRINTKIWKLNFQSLYLKLQPQDGIVNMPGTKKYLRLNTLGIDATKWLNISFFDAVVLGRKNGFELNYILPVTFLRAMEHESGSPDNALFGLNVKANIAGRLQLYSQFLLDEFKLSEIKAQSGWWANKYGYQLGAKYIDAFGVKNLDIQLETNRVRPFTYSHFDSVSNYTHYNQPLAHPLGASLHEFIGIVHYQPGKKMYVKAKLIYYTQGLDSLGYNTGNNVLINYNSRPHEYGWEVSSGNKAKCLYLYGLISYELMNNLFVDAAVMNRNYKTQLTGNLKTTMVSLGFRLNISRREFDF